MVHMLWIELSMSCVLFHIETTVRKVVPPCFGLVGEQNICTVVVFKPSPDSLGEEPDMLGVWTLMQPVIEWALEFFSKSVQVRRWELTLQSWHHVVDWESVS